MHCGSQQQAVIAKYYKEILVDIFVINENNPPTPYPSPNDLQRKFIILEQRAKITKNSSGYWDSNPKLDFKIQIEEAPDDFDKENFDDIRKIF
jgi:hypothetical protein